MTVTTETALRYIDSDGHVLEPPHALLDYGPAEYRDRIFHVETADDGSEWEVWNGQRIPAVGLSGTAGFPDEKVQQVLSGAIPYSQVRPAGWDAALRLADMDMDGIDVSVLYPTRLLGLQSFTDLDFTVVQAHAYNGWLSDHVQQAPGRLYGAAVLPAMHDADGVAAVAAEIRRVATLPGIVSVLIRPNPSVDWRPFNDPVYDPIWAAAAETALPIGLHPFLVPDLPGAAQGLRLGLGVGTGEGGGSSGYAQGIGITQAIANPVDVMSSLCFLTMGGVCERFPGLKAIFLEANGGWLVPWLERLDHHVRKFPWEMGHLRLLPSEYFRRQCWISFDPDETMLAFTARSPLCGADRIIWASDYPHPDAKFPGVTDELAAALAELSPEERRTVTSESAKALYSIA
jgi:predicted TIM-barrel fold metal-dependent hydrolase